MKNEKSIDGEAYAREFTDNTGWCRDHPGVESRKFLTFAAFKSSANYTASSTSGIASTPSYILFLSTVSGTLDSAVSHFA